MTDLTAMDKSEGELLKVTPEIPRSPSAAALIARLSAELACRYDHMDDGSGNFRPDDMAAPLRGIFSGRISSMAGRLPAAKFAHLTVMSAR